MRTANRMSRTARRRVFSPAMDHQTLANVIGSAAALCSITSFIPQALKIWKTRDASAVSLRTYSLTVSCFILWVIYGAMTEAKMAQKMSRRMTMSEIFDPSDILLNLLNLTFGLVAAALAA